jgi:hypothetical protein
VTWLGASKLLGRPVTGDEPYPCVCWVRRRDCMKSEPWGCPCWGRPMIASLPPDCCARRDLRNLANVGGDELGAALVAVWMAFGTVDILTS